MRQSDLKSCNLVPFVVVVAIYSIDCNTFGGGGGGRVSRRHGGLLM